MKKSRLLTPYRTGSVLLVVLVVLSSCTETESGKMTESVKKTEATTTEAPAVMSRNSLPAAPSDLSGLSSREAMNRANEWGRRENAQVSSSVTSQEITFIFNEGDTVRVPLPDDVMVVSIAPYIMKTHPCGTHSMSGCQGEITDAEVAVRASLKDGTVLIDELMPIQPNGFLDLWLPRDQEIFVRMETLGRSTEGRIETFEASNTCITTLQLS